MPTNMPMAAMAIPTGPARAVSTPDSPPRLPAAPLITVDRFDMTPTILGAIAMSPPRPDVSFPRITSAGPSAAASSPILAIICLWLSSRLLNRSIAS